MTKDGSGHYKSFDPNEYLHHLDGLDMTEEKKLEYVELIWNIMSEFVAYGWGVHPIQQAMEARARDKKSEPEIIRDAVREFVKSEKPEWLDPKDSQTKTE